MTNSGDPDAGAARPAPEASRRRLPWWVAGITFVGGFVFGILAVGLLNVTTPEFATQAGPGQGGPTPASPTSGPSVPVVAEARVNAGCLAVINDAQDVYGVLTGLDQAVTDVDLQQLDDMVRRLQPIEGRLGRDLQQCEIEGGSVSTAPTPPVPDPTAPLPSGSPTR